MPKSALVSNTSPLLYLGRIGQAHLLPELFEPVYVPEQVILELDAGRMLRADIIDPGALAWLKRVTVPPSSLERLPPNRLGLGEQAVIAYALTQPGCLVGLDDRQARLLAHQLGLMIVGTVGILVKAKQAGLIPTARTLLDAVQTQGLRLSPDLYAEALKLVGE